MPLLCPRGTERFPSAREAHVAFTRGHSGTQSPHASRKATTAHEETLQPRYQRTLANLEFASRELPHVLIFDNDDLRTLLQMISSFNREPEACVYRGGISLDAHASGSRLNEGTGDATLELIVLT